MSQKIAVVPLGLRWGSMVALMEHIRLGGTIGLGGLLIVKSSATESFEGIVLGPCDYTIRWARALGCMCVLEILQLHGAPTPGAIDSSSFSSPTSVYNLLFFHPFCHSFFLLSVLFFSGTY